MKKLSVYPSMEKIMRQKETHRGITTNPNPRFEKELITTMNRFGQFTFTLPRIDDKKRWAGFPGNTGISRRLAKIIPPCVKYVEPFAGTAKVYQELIKLTEKQGYPGKFILNDKSKKISKWLQILASLETKITCTDFITCVKKHDSKQTVFLFDPPWFKTYYDQIFSCFDRESVIDYDEQVLHLCHNMKGKFFITSRIENKRMKDSGFKNMLIRSEYVVAGKLPQVLITTNVTKGDY